jgi:dynein light intermediate chain, axonemal
VVYASYSFNTFIYIYIYIYYIQILALQEGKAALEYKAVELRNRVEITEKRSTEQRSIEDKKRKEEIDFLKYQGQHLDSFLNQIGGSK